MKIILSIIFIFIVSTSTLSADSEIDLIKLYKELHLNPELSFKEEKTSKTENETVSGRSTKMII